MEHKTIGIADTMFARGDMGGLAVKTLEESGKPVSIVRYTVPGIKDLPVACLKLFEERHCDLVIALGMAGAQPIDKQCSHEASLGIQMVQVKTAKHIIEVFVHEDEAQGDDAKLASLMHNRTFKHAHNALALLFAPNSLTTLAGTGERQGGPNANPVKL